MTFFQKWLLKIKTHFAAIYTKRYFSIKITIALIVAVFVLGFAFGIRQLILDSKETNGVIIPNFLELNVVLNSGIAFGWLQNSNIYLVYFVQIIPLLIAFGFWISIKSYYSDIALSFLIFGGLSNVVDRIIIDNFSVLTAYNINNTNTVVDYLRFYNNSAIFNLADVFVLLGISLLIIKNITVSILSSFKNFKNKQDEKPIKEHIIIEKN